MRKLVSAALVLSAVGVFVLVGVPYPHNCRANLPDDWTDVDAPTPPPTPPSAPVYPVYHGPPPGYFRSQYQNNSNSNSNSNDTSPSGQMTLAQSRLYDGQNNNNLGCKSFKAGDLASALSYFETAVADDPSNQMFLTNLAITQNELGCTVLRGGDYEAALEYFKQASAHDPGNSIYADNIALVQRLIVQKRQAELQRRQDVAAVGQITQSIQALAQQMSNASSGGKSSDGNAALTFESPAATADQGGGLTLGFSDPMLTIPWPAQTLPSVVSQGINHDFGNAPPEVQHNVTNGYLAVMHHDWALAKACFTAALNHDPGSAPLQRLVSWSTASAQESPGLDANSTPHSGVTFNAPGGPPDFTNPGPSSIKGPGHTETEPPVPIIHKESPTLMAKFMALINSSNK